jgi:hypothetical protein
MAFLYTNQEVLDYLRGDNEDADLYWFIEIYTGVSGNSDYNDIYLTSYPEDITVSDNLASSKNVAVLWESNLLGGVSTPSRTGNVSQEIQRLSIAQGLDSAYGNAQDDLLRRIGPAFHNAEIVMSLLLQPYGSSIITSEPIIRTDGIIKSVTRDTSSEDEVVIDFSNSFGKLDSINELRTSPGSIKRRNELDTCFDKAAKSLKRTTYDWGVPR